MSLATLAPRAHAAARASLIDPPASAVIWYRYDPNVLPSAPAQGATPMQRTLLLSAVRAGLSSGLFREKTPARALQALLAAAELGDTAHLGAILDFGARRKPDGSGMIIEHFQGVISIDDTSRVPAFLRTIRALALATSGADPSALTQAPLRGVQGAVRLTSSAWPEWMAMEWTVRGGRFLLGIGRGSLQTWLAPAGAEQDPGAWIAHRTLVDAQRPARTPFLEAWVDLDALRAAFPSAFGSGRTPRMLDALGLGGASGVMLHAAVLKPDAENPPGLPPLIALDWTTAPIGQREPVTRRALSASAWPGDDATGLAPPPGTSILVSPVDWARLFDWSLDVYAATVQDTDLPDFERALQSWRAAHAEALEALLGSLRPYLVLSDVPPPLLPIPGLASVFVASDGGGRDTRALEALTSDVLAPFADRLLVAGPAGAKTWALKVDDRGVVRLPAWGFVLGPEGPILVGGWGLPVVEENRARLAPGPPSGEQAPR